MRCVIVLGGECGNLGYSFTEGDFVISCDSGYDNARKLGLPTHLLIGDMDSISEIPKEPELMEFSVRKDDTDCMLAIKEGVARGYHEYILLCGFGGRRTDHLLANIQSMIYISRLGHKVEMCGKDEWCRIIRDEDVYITPMKNGSQAYSLSVFAVDGDAVGVTLEGVSYPLNNSLVSEGFPIGVSNFITGETAHITVKKGCLVVICSPMGEYH